MALLGRLIGLAPVFTPRCDSWSWNVWEFELNYFWMGFGWWVFRRACVLPAAVKPACICRLRSYPSRRRWRRKIAAGRRRSALRLSCRRSRGCRTRHAPPENNTDRKCEHNEAAAAFVIRDEEVCFTCSCSKGRILSSQSLTLRDRAVSWV